MLGSKKFANLIGSIFSKKSKKTHSTHNQERKSKASCVPRKIWTSSKKIRNEVKSQVTNTPRSSPLDSPFVSNDSFQKDGDHLRLPSPYGSPPKKGLDCSVLSLSSGGSVSEHGHVKSTVNLSTAVSSSSQDSGHDSFQKDGDDLFLDSPNGSPPKNGLDKAFPDVFVWGEGTGEGVLGGGGAHRVGSLNMDSLLPKAIESTVGVLDIQNIACGGRHAALVTKKGEIFSWGEESRGWLGHGVDCDVLVHPKLVDALSSKKIQLVACGEYHTCAVSLSGDLYTWGHGNEVVSQWVPKRVNGPLEGLHVSSISCGPWHTAVVTSSGQLFTFGDGTFGVLGHGDRKSLSVPREVESLKGLRTVRAACGVWHTAAIVQVVVGNANSGKLFTWGDGDKSRLGHGEDKKAKLVPTCVAALVESNFCQVACGQSMTIALTTLGHVYAMGSPVYGQLGNPHADGKLPSRVDGRLSKRFVEEIACGAYHVAVVTSKNEVFTWGKGENGRLGHGDTHDRNFPSLVEALKDKQVKTIACGTNFTAAICHDKWVSGIDQSLCSGCCLAFNFTRKRHNCYNCGLVFCHSCSSKKTLEASMAPNPKKPYRVCDNCFNELRKTIETDASSHSCISRRGSSSSSNQGSNIEFTDKDEKLVSSKNDLTSQVMGDNNGAESGGIRTKSDGDLQSLSLSMSPSTSQSSGVTAASEQQISPTVTDCVVREETKKIGSDKMDQRQIVRKRSQGAYEMEVELEREEEEEEAKLQKVIKSLTAQVETLTRKSRLQEVELERTTKHIKEAISVAREEAGKVETAREFINSLTVQLKDIVQRLPVGAAPASHNVSSALVDHKTNGQIASSQEPDTNAPSITSLRNATTKQDQKDSESSNHEAQLVVFDDPGVYITLISLPGGVRHLKGVCFSRKRFGEMRAKQWWAQNRARIFQEHNVRSIDKSSVGVGCEDFDSLAISTQD